MSKDSDAAPKRPATDTDPSSDLSSPGQAALALAAQGFHVLPQYGKKPFTARGFLDASTDPAQITRWWTEHPTANVGIASGHELPDGGFLYIVDVDPRNGGLESYAALETDIGQLPLTRTVESGGGGAHLYMRTAFRLRGTKLKKYPGLDFQPVQVVAPPSIHESGKAYELAIDLPIAQVPDALVQKILEETKQSGQGFAVAAVELESGDGRVEKADAWLATAPLSIEGDHGRDVFFGVAVVLVRKMLLPIAVAAECIERVYNPRLVAAGTTPWEGSELYERLESARTTSDAHPGTVLSKATHDGFRELAATKSNPNRTPIAPAEKSKEKVGADHSYDGERSKLSKTALTQMLFNWPDWDGVFWYDVLSQKTRATNPPTKGKLTLEDGEMSDGDLAVVAHWFDSKGFLVSKDQVKDAIATVVRDPARQRNLIAEYLDSLPKVTETKVLPTLATELLGSEDGFANTLVMKTLVAAVRRARKPGAFHKSMLVLRGPQGYGKTPFVKILAGPFYHSTGNGNLAERDTILECQGKMLVEVEELSALSRADAGALKTAISRTSDVITKKYEPDGRTYPRSFILIGTTNKDEFLTDETGNERYHVVNVTKRIDLARLESIRDVIWAEADYLASQGYSNELDGAEKGTLDEANKGYLQKHPWLDEVAKYLRGKKYVFGGDEVLMSILKGDATKATKKGLDDVVACMVTLECKRRQRTIDGVPKVWVYVVPEELASVAPSTASVRPLRAS